MKVGAIELGSSNSFLLHGEDLNHACGSRRRKWIFPSDCFQFIHIACNSQSKAKQGEGRRASTFLVFTTSPIYLCKAHWENHSQSKGRRLVCHGGGTRWSLWVRNLTFVQNISKALRMTIVGCFIYILNSSNSSSYTFWSSKLPSSSRSNWYLKR